MYLTHLQKIISKELHVLLLDNYLIEIRERRQREIPDAYNDIRQLNEYLKHKVGLNFKIEKLMYDFHCGNVAYVDCTYIDPWHRLERAQLLKIGAKLPESAWINEKDLHIEWVVLTVKEYYENKIK